MIFKFIEAQHVKSKIRCLEGLKGLAGSRYAQRVAIGDDNGADLAKRAMKSIQDEIDILKEKL